MTDLHGMQEVRGSSPLSSTLKSLQDKDLRQLRIVPILYQTGCTNRCTKSVGSARRIPAGNEPEVCGS